MIDELVKSSIFFVCLDLEQKYLFSDEHELTCRPEIFLKIKKFSIDGIS